MEIFFLDFNRIFQENILIYPKGKEGQNGIKVIDFGSSCYENERSKLEYFYDVD